jgi:hypothetical protein
LKCQIPGAGRAGNSILVSFHSVTNSWGSEDLRVKVVFLVPSYGGPIHNEMPLFDLDMGPGSTQGEEHVLEQNNKCQGWEQKSRSRVGSIELPFCFVSKYLKTYTWPQLLQVWKLSNSPKQGTNSSLICLWMTLVQTAPGRRKWGVVCQWVVSYSNNKE